MWARFYRGICRFLNLFNGFVVPFIFVISLLVFYLCNTFLSLLFLPFLTGPLSKDIRYAFARTIRYFALVFFVFHFFQLFFLFFFCATFSRNIGLASSFPFLGSPIAAQLIMYGNFICATNQFMDFRLAEARYWIRLEKGTISTQPSCCPQDCNTFISAMVPKPGDI